MTYTSPHYLQHIGKEKAINEVNQELAKYQAKASTAELAYTEFNEKSKGDMMVNRVAHDELLGEMLNRYIEDFLVFVLYYIYIYMSFIFFFILFLHLLYFYFKSYSYPHPIFLTLSFFFLFSCR